MKLWHIQSEHSTPRNYTAEKKNSIFYCKSQQNYKLLSRRSALILNCLREGLWVQGLKQPKASCLWPLGPSGAHADADTFYKHRDWHWSFSLLQTKYQSGSSTQSFESWPVWNSTLGLKAGTVSPLRCSVSKLWLQIRTAGRQMDTRLLCCIQHSIINRWHYVINNIQVPGL